MSNGFQKPQGFGTASPQTELQRQLLQEQRMQEEMRLAAGLAKLPNTEMAYDWLGADQPKGGMVGNHYVPPSITQNLAAMTKQGLGGMMVKRRGDQAAALAEALAARYANPSKTPVPAVDPYEVDGVYGG